MNTDTSKFQYKRYHIPNLVKAIGVWDVLSESENGLTQLELMKATGFAQSAVFRILATLQDYGLVDKNPADNRYTLSKLFAQMALGAEKAQKLIRGISDIMVDIRDAVKETTMLGIMLEDRYVMLQQEVGTHSFNYTGTVGLKCPMHTAAGAKAMLAFMPEERAKKYVDKIEFVKYNANTITDAKTYWRVLRQARELGYATDEEEYVRGMNCVAVPILDKDGMPTSSIWVTGPSERLRREDFGKIAETMKQKCTLD